MYIRITPSTFLTSGAPFNDTIQASFYMYVILLVCETILQYERYIKKFYLSGTPNAAYIC